MTKGERVRAVRKENGLTLEKFGERIGMKKNSVSQIENGVSSLTNTVSALICREFNINEEWLNTGEGDMHIPLTKNQRYASIAAKLKFEDDDLKTSLCEFIAEADSVQLKASLYELVRFLKNSGIDFDL